MSMISAQIDELRELALWLDDEFYDVEATKVRDAADTIWQLRDDLQRANEAVRDAEHDESRAWDRVRKAEAEADRLRELVKALLTCATDGDCDECRLNGATPWHVGKAQLCDGVWDRVRELGVEVDR